MRIGYLAEAPVWRASYRLVLDDHPNAAGASALQGWALVHNDTDEDWDDVAIELVNGRPDSFLFPLAAPRYERRDLVVPDRELSSVPQLLDTTPDAMWGDFLDVEESGYGGGSGSGYGRGGSAGFGGRSSRSPTVRSATTVVGSDLVSVGNLAALAVGEGRETKTVFVYGTAEPLDLAAGRSAMVPFVQSELESAAVSWITGFGNVTARHAVHVRNSTTQTLPEGTLGVFSDGGFSGETMLPRLKPGERRFLEIGDDPDTEMTVLKSAVLDVPQRLVWRGGRWLRATPPTGTFEAARDLLMPVACPSRFVASSSSRPPTHSAVLEDSENRRLLVPFTSTAHPVRGKCGAWPERWPTHGPPSPLSVGQAPETTRVNERPERRTTAGGGRLSRSCAVCPAMHPGLRRPRARARTLARVSRPPRGACGLAARVRP